MSMLRVPLKLAAIWALYVFGQMATWLFWALLQPEPTQTFATRLLWNNWEDLAILGLGGAVLVTACLEINRTVGSWSFVEDAEGGSR